MCALGSASMLLVSAFEWDVAPEKFLEDKMGVTGWLLEKLNLDKELPFSFDPQDAQFLDFIRGTSLKCLSKSYIGVACCRFVSCCFCCVMLCFSSFSSSSSFPYSLLLFSSLLVAKPTKPTQFSCLALLAYFPTSVLFIHLLPISHPSAAYLLFTDYL